MKKPEIPKALDAMVAKVLAYRPKPKTKAARKRKKMQSILSSKQNINHGESTKE
ncbi:MAG: hypothetical protein WBW81_06720 [Methylocella sp.]